MAKFKAIFLLAVLIVSIPFNQAYAVGEPVYIQSSQTYVDSSQADATINNADITIQEATVSQRPFAPTGLVAFEVKQTSLKLSWQGNDPAENVTAYKIYKDGIATSTATSNLLKIEDLTPGQEYSFYITAQNSYGEGKASEVIKVKTISQTASPENLTVTNVVYDGATIKWSGNSPEYHIFLNNEQIGNTSNNQYRISGLDSDKNYAIYVTAVDNGFESEKSNTVKFQTISLPEQFSITNILYEAWNYIYQTSWYLGIILGIGFAFFAADILPSIFRKIRWRWL